MLRDNNPKHYWKLLEQVTNSKKCNTIFEVSGSTWYTYFKQLNKNDNQIGSKNLLSSLLNMEEERIFSELDIKISLKVIQKEIKNLKNNKACGFYLILNEIIKASQLYLLESLQKIFNTVLSTGVYPKIWAKGYIVPIFKNGSKDDPSNYRGIIIGSCLWKLFGKIMNTRLEKFLSSRNIISLEQIGFCKEKKNK